MHLGKSIINQQKRDLGKKKNKRKTSKRGRIIRKLTRKTKNKYKTTPMRGGLRKRLTDEIVNSFISPHKPEFNMDCCPCVFALLGIPKVLVSRLQELHKKGFSKNQLLKVMDTQFPGYEHSLFTSQYFGNGGFQGSKIVNEALNKIFNSIPPGTGAIGGLTRRDNTAHCIAFARDADGLRIIMDAQSSQIYVGNKVRTWINRIEDKTTHLYILNSKRKDGKQLYIDVNGNDNTEQFWEENKDPTVWQTDEFNGVFKKNKILYPYTTTNRPPTLMNENDEYYYYNEKESDTDDNVSSPMEIDQPNAPSASQPFNNTNNFFSNLTGEDITKFKDAFNNHKNISMTKKSLFYN